MILAVQAVQASVSDTIWRDLVGALGVPGAALLIFIGILLWRLKWPKADAPPPTQGNGTAAAAAKAKAEALEYAHLERLAEDTQATVDQMFPKVSKLDDMAELLGEIVKLQRAHLTEQARITALLEAQQRSLELHGGILDYLATGLRRDIQSDVRDVVTGALAPPLPRRRRP